MKSIIIAAGAGLAAAHTRSTFQKEEFLVKGRSAPTAEVSFTVGMPSNNWERVQSMLAERSNPKSPNYAEWLPMEAVAAMTATEEPIRESVRAWMTKSGAQCVDWNSALRCTAPAKAIEEAFKTELHEFDQVDTKTGSLVRTIHRVPNDIEFSLPQELAGRMLFVSGLYDFPTKRMRLGSGINAVRPEGLKAPDADLIITTESLEYFYQTTAVTGSAASITAPAEFQADQAILASDIKKFATEMGIPDWKIAHKQGAFSGSDTEATLDGQYIAGVGQNNTQFWWTEPDWMYEWVQHLASAKNLSMVYSVSWGWSEADQCTVDGGQGPCPASGGTVAQSHAYVDETNKGFAAAGLAGTTIVISSGDSGAHGRTDGSCASKATLPDWPTASPYVLAVGATQILNGKAPATPKSPYCQKPSQGDCAASGDEVVASPATGALIASGGGFSNVAAQPTWQADAVKAYLASGALLPPAGDFNSTSRGYPDVSALGHNVLIYQGGQPLPVDGTSCSAPMWGGVIGLANAARLAAGKKQLGFVNPAIYQVAASTPAAFIDITSGDNTCTEDGCTPGCTGFGATKGWDATTGFGSPVVPTLVAALAAL